MHQVETSIGEERTGRPARTDRRALLRLVLPVVLVSALVVGGIAAAGLVAKRRAAGELLADAGAGLPLAVAALRGELEKQRTVPLILAGDAAIRDMLAAPDPARLAAANGKLLALAGATRAAVIYILDRSGVAVAASNHLEPTSFVGSDYRFRRYYAEAIADGTAEQYALGTVSNQPGVYFSHRVEGPDAAPLGVVVVKVELASVEADWRDAGRPVYVTDARGIVLATSVPEWRFRTLRAIGPGEAAEIRESLQFGAAPLDPLPVRPTGQEGKVQLLTADMDGAAGPRSAEGLFVEAVSAVEGGLDGWRLHLLVPAGRALSLAAATAQTVAGLALALVLGVGAVLARRVREGRRRLAERTQAAVELEARVVVRTAELSRANGLLVSEIAERTRAEARVVSLREDLIQANRLAALGQITAGVAHEINQPLAAIRTYAENAGRFLDRDDAASVRGNLDSVVGLADRIGTITETLRSFSRRATGAAGPLPLAEPIEGAMLILDSRIRDSGVDVARDPVDARLAVVGNRIRLEQVLVNLVRNAIEALEGRPEPRIALRVEEQAGDVLLHVVDNGPGIAPDIMAVLFTPFSTSKPRGLGLGLVISSDIVADLGGSLTVESRPGEGAHFTVRLRRAKG